MRFVFVYWRIHNAGSAQPIRHYAEAARAMGHEIALFGPPDPTGRFNCSQEVRGDDAVIFIMEWNLGGPQRLMDIPEANLARLLATIPRHRRIVLDNDGMYNDYTRIDGDYTHPVEAEAKKRSELFESIADKIVQPCYHPRRKNVGTLVFHGYRPEWEVPLDFSKPREFGMFYVGSNWFRWRAMKKVLSIIAPIRDRIGRIGLVGHDWAAMPHWVPSPFKEEAYFTDPDYLRQMGVEILPAVPIEQVIPSMSRGVFNPVLVRPTFNCFRVMNPRLFETPAANTIPLFNLDREYVCETYGEEAGKLVLDQNAQDLILDVLRQPQRYSPIVAAMRRHLAEKHSFAVRMRELVELVNN
jgi:hypothetical protein